MVFFEGHIVFTLPEIRKRFNKTVFIDTDMDIALIRRIRRDVESRGRSVNDVLSDYEKYVRPSAQALMGIKSNFDLLVNNIDYDMSLDKMHRWLKKEVDLK